MNEEIYSKYLKRLEIEKDEYLEQLYHHTLPEEIFQKLDDAVAFRDAYEYLRSPDISDEELHYVMQAMNPINEVAGFQRAYELEMDPENLTAITVYDMCSKKLFESENIPKYTDRVPIQFHRKIGSLDEIKSLPRNREDEDFVILKVVELSPKDFDKFSGNLLESMPFLPFVSNESFQMIQDGAWRCMLVHDKERSQGMLVESSGFDYARYSAYVENTKDLDLSDIPTEKWQLPRGRNRTLEKPPKQPER